MRDLTRANALRPAWKRLLDDGFEVFTPMVWKSRRRNGKMERTKVPAIHDLLFVNSERETLDKAVDAIPTLQYRFLRGSFGNAMTVPRKEMERFRRAVSESADTRYYASGELTQSMIGKGVRIEGGPLDGMRGKLLSVRGMRKKRLIVEIAGMVAAAVEISPEYIRPDVPDS